MVLIILQKKVMEIREQLKRIALRLGIVLKSCERDTQVNKVTYWFNLKKETGKREGMFLLPLFPLGEVWYF